MLHQDDPRVFRFDSRLEKLNNNPKYQISTNQINRHMVTLSQPILISLLILLFFLFSTNYFLVSSVVSTVWSPSVQPCTSLKVLPKDAQCPKCPESKKVAPMTCFEEKNSSGKKRYKIALTFTATKHYSVFINRLLETAEKFFLPQHEVHYFIFTDKEIDPKFAKNKRVHKMYFQWKPWPHSSLARHSLNLGLINDGHLKGFDFMYWLDVDSKFVGYVGEEILGNWMGTVHSEQANWYGTEILGSNTNIRMKTPIKPLGHYDQAKFMKVDKTQPFYIIPPYEMNSSSEAYVDYKSAKYYFNGGFCGGRLETVKLNMERLLEMKKRDEKKGISGAFNNDESYLNALNWKYPPDVVLGWGYMSPTDLENHPWQWVGWDDWTKPPPTTARFFSEPKVLNLGLEVRNWKYDEG
jgi:hypothetical protein